MAATTRASTPSSETFPAHEALPRTPTSLSSSNNFPPPFTGSENPNLLRPTSAHKVTFTTADISPKSQQSRYSPARSPAPLTGAAAMADLKRRKQQKAADEASRQTSPNPQVEAMQSLMGGGGMSRPSDAPAPDKLSEPLRKAAEKMRFPDAEQSDHSQTSPVSLSSFGTVESTGAPLAMTATAANPSTSAPQYVAEPAEMNEGGSYSSSNGMLRVPVEEDANKALSFSYPGPPQQDQGRDSGPSRSMTLPGYGQTSPKSPASANKRHKCPYCSTDFTRHHNLKSHLLTHSQEKPYVCQTCQARFRRLHDLKRHTKLHTGERPHTCDKCGRRFARGDALARHNKGPGGCAGRRSSFGGDDDYDGPGDGMDGVEYTGEGEGEDEDEVATTDSHGRRVSEPSRKRVHLETPADPNRQVYRQHSSTYPPLQQSQRMGDMGPPQVIHPGSSAATSPRDISGHPSPAAGSSITSSYYPQPAGQIFAQHGGVMTESPKPLSPGQPPEQHRLTVKDPNATSIHRNRSPSLTTQLQQTRFGRGTGNSQTPPQPTSAQYPPTSHQNLAPQLPPLTLNNSVAAQQARAALQPSSLPAPPTSLLHHQQNARQSSQPSSASSHGRSSGSSMRDVMLGGGMAPAEQQAQGDIWAYVRSLEARLSRMQDEYELRIIRLQEEVMGLKGQMSNAASYSSEMAGQPRY